MLSFGVPKDVLLSFSSDEIVFCRYRIEGKLCYDAITDALVKDLPLRIVLNTRCIEMVSFDVQEDVSEGNISIETASHRCYIERVL